MTAWPLLSARIRELDALAGAAAVLEWDQQTQAPPKSAVVRGEQTALLQRIYHERFTASEVGGWLSELQGGDLDGTQAASVRLLRRRYDRAVNVPPSLVGALSVARTEGFHAWVAAKEADDFATFEPKLQRILDLTREQAAALGSAQCAHPYDALLEEYDPGSTVGALRPMFDRLGRELGVFLNTLEGLPHPAPFDPRLDIDGQKRLSERVLRDLGFDMEGGRLDRSAHPFTMGLGTGDVRLTTRFMEDNFISGLGSTVHECGHGMYEQGLPASLAGTGLNQAAGMGLHESQSRFWENFIGRSLPFFRYLAPRMGAIWPTHTFAPEVMFGAANRVQRSLIRVEADEATYNLHIIVRFGLEIDILEGKLQARDLPDAWDAAYGRVVGVVAPSAKQGVLQDVHWSSGLFGYFPSYTIGNLYAASFAQCLVGDIPDLWEHVERGDFAPILGWMRTRVHASGHTKDAPELFREVAGNRDAVEDLMAHLWSRHGALYGVRRPG